MKKKVLLWIPLLLFLLMTVVTALVYRYFGQPWAGICAFVTYGGYMLHSLLTRKKRQQEQDEELQQLEKELAELAEEEEPLFAEVGDDGKLPFLMMHHSFNARYYQVFRSAKEYRFVHVGNEFKGIDPERMLEECPGEKQLAQMKNSFSIRKEDVRRFTVAIKKSAMATPLPTSGVVTFYAPKKMRYDLLFEVTPQQAEQFFSDLRDRTEKKEKAYHRQKAKAEGNMSLGQWRKENQDPGTFKLLKKLTLALTVAGAALSLAFYFLPVPYKLTAWVLVVLGLTALLLPLIFPAYYSLWRTSEEAKQAEGADAIGWMGPALACNAGLMLRGLIDFNFLDLWKVFAFGGVLAVAMMVAYTLRCRELRWRVGVILGLLFMLFIFCMGLPAQLNFLLDTSEPILEEKTVMDMHISASSKGPDSYYCTVDLQGREVDIDVGKEAYSVIKVGDTVVVAVRKGALGMAYCGILTDG